MKSALVEWKEILGYEKLYLVGNNGGIYNLITNKKMVLMNHKLGYLRVGLTKNKKQKHYLVHRIVAQAFVMNYHDKPHINHKDSNKLNNNYTNLEWCTAKENIQHSIKNERSSLFVKILVINKVNREQTKLGSQVKASYFIGKSRGYIGEAIGRGKFENNDYKWEVVS